MNVNTPMTTMDSKTSHLSSTLLIRAAADNNATVMRWLLRNGCIWRPTTFSLALNIYPNTIALYKLLVHGGCPYGDITTDILSCSLSTVKWFHSEGFIFDPDQIEECDDGDLDVEILKWLDSKCIYTSNVPPPPPLVVPLPQPLPPPVFDLATSTPSSGEELWRVSHSIEEF